MSTTLTSLGMWSMRLTSQNTVRVIKEQKCDYVRMYKEYSFPNVY